jgi:hypothetical protein
MTEARDPAGFRSCVLAWVQREYPEWRAVEVLQVEGDGSDWEGDTESGFYSRFNVEIKIRVAERGAGLDPHTAKDLAEAHTKRDDLIGFKSITGEDAESLWSHVVRSARFE